jgi:imidazoleglycerol-phosphate dehydratase
MSACGRSERALSESTADESLVPRLRVRAAVSDSTQQVSVSTGLPALDHLITLLAEYGAFDLSLEVEPGAAADEVAAAGLALGEALGRPLRERGARGHGSAVVPADEALAHVAIEASGRPLVVSNVDARSARLGGLDTDVVAEFLRRLAEGAGLTVHVRLIEGKDAQHVLEAIFKALGVALAQACRPRRREPTL